MQRILITLAILAIASPPRLTAGDNPRSVRAVRVTTPPRIDGVLDDDVWRLAEPATDFIQRDPEEGKPASERSEIRVLYDDEALYFGCVFYDSDPAGILARMTRRDNEIESDNASVRIDSYHDHQTCFEFTFNAAGVKTDILEFDDANIDDDSWDPVWDLQTSVNDHGWVAELKIPFRILRYRTPPSDTSENVWGINFLRYISRKQESDRWAFTPKSQSGFISRFGHLVGLRRLPEPRQLEFLPFVTGKQQYLPGSDQRDRNVQFAANGGADVKYGLASNLTLDATINPDFGQVEADPAVLNLTTLETFYPERRPFFVEGTQIIHFTTFGGTFGPGMFYSRRIGRAISAGEVAVPAGGRILDLPQAVTILGAAKLSGKTSGGLSIGMLQAFTREERATVADSLGAVSEQVLEPFAHYNVIRLKQDVLENSNVGMIVTSVEKNGRFPALTNGYDWNLVFEHNTYTLSGFLALSRTTDAASERVNGSAGKIAFSRIAGVHWLWSISGDYTSKRYNIDDVGFFFSPNDAGGVATLTYKEDVPAQVVRSYDVGATLHIRNNFDGVNLFREARLSNDILFGNYWRWSLGGDADAGLYDERETRGNGLYGKPVNYSATGSLSTDTRNSVVVGLTQQVGRDSKKKRLVATTAEIDFNPLSWMEWQVSTNYQRVGNQEAWVLNDTTGRSIFADRSTDAIGFMLRSTITFTRELTLQLYGQVFLAKGHYENFRYLAGTSDFISGAPNPGSDFNEQTLNTNVVLRWEYFRGSTLYLVWSQARNGRHGNYFTDFQDDVDRTFAIAPSNILLLKVSYWWSL